MSQYANKKLAIRVAEEAQLIAEEKWILDALDKIRAQRNSLQIEKLQLESMKGMLKDNKTKVPEIRDQFRAPDISRKAPVTFNLSMMQNMTEPKPVEPSTPNRNLLETESQCNKEELNLNVLDSIFHKNLPNNNNYNIEDDEDEEEENGEDLLIDMNMFMNGTLN